MIHAAKNNLIPNKINTLGKIKFDYLSDKSAIKNI